MERHIAFGEIYKPIRSSTELLMSRHKRPKQSSLPDLPSEIWPRQRFPNSEKMVVGFYPTRRSSNEETLERNASRDELEFPLMQPLERVVSFSDLSIQGASNIQDNIDAIPSTSTSKTSIAFTDKQKKVKKLNEFDSQPVKHRRAIPIPKDGSKLAEYSFKDSKKLTEDTKKNKLSVRNHQNNNNNSQQVVNPKHSPKLRHNNICQQVNNQECSHAPKAKAKCFCICSILFLPMLLSILVVLISVFLYENQDRRSSCDFATAVIELKKRIHGQDQAVHALCDYLQLDTLSSKVIVLVGGTGVGKSYTMEIIKKNFPRQYAIRQHSTIEAVTEINLPFLYPNLIILENLRKHDLEKVLNFLKERQDAMRDRYVTVLAVINIEEMDGLAKRSIDLKQDLNAIKHAFADRKIDAKIIPYHSLSEATLQNCVIDAILDSDVMLTDDQIARVTQNLLITQAGCKGAYNKVQLIGRP